MKHHASPKIEAGKSKPSNFKSHGYESDQSVSEVSPLTQLLMGSRSLKKTHPQKSGNSKPNQSVSGPYTIQRMAYPQGPELQPHKKDNLNKIGAISAPSRYYPDAVASGMNIRSKPAPGKDLVIGKIKYGQSVFIKANDSTDTWFYVVGQGGTAGWIDQNFVAEDKPEVNATLHHITEKNLTSIVKHHYVDTGRWELSTGNDYTTLVTAIAVANRKRRGVKIDHKKYHAYRDKMYTVDWTWNPIKLFKEVKDAAKANFDPTMENFAIFQASEVRSGHNIWLPSASYIKTMQEKGIIASRPDWMNKAIQVGQGISGFAEGIFTGFFGGIVDALEGIWELGKGMINMIGDLITGRIFSQLKAIYDEFRNMTWEKAKQIAMALLSAVVEGLNKFRENWNHGDMFKRWRFRGVIVGNILLEVVLAIFTAGAGNAVKWAGKLGKIAPKLSSILIKAINKANDLLPQRFRRKNKHSDPNKPDSDDLKDNRAAQKMQALTLAKSITETHDAKNSSITALKASLFLLKKKFKVIDRFEVSPVSNKKYKVWMIASRHPVDNDYTPGDFKDRISEIAKKYPLFKCMDCADEIVKLLQKEGLKGKIVTIKAKGDPGRGYIYSDKLKKSISTNQLHRGVLVDGKIYDNIHPEGISLDKWRDDFHSVWGYDINYTEF